MKKMYSTKDFYLSCLLFTKGFWLIDSTKKTEGVYFNFEVHDEELLQQLLSDFINYKVLVEMHKFTNAMSRLRKELQIHK